MPRNVTVFLILEGILAAFRGFILPVYVLYFRYYSISLFEVALLAAIFEASVLVFEIPTGLFADRFGRKLSVALGCLTYAASGLVFVLFRGLPGFIAAEILFGLAEAFISGAAEALAVDSIPRSEKTVGLQRMFTARSRVRIAVMSVFMVAAGYLFSGEPTITFYPVLVGGIAGLIIALFFVSDKRSSDDQAPQTFLAPLHMAWRRMKLSALLRLIFLVSLAANFAYEAADQYWQVLLSELFAFDVRYFGYLTAAGAMAAFILVGPVVRRFAGNISLPLLVLLMSGVILSSLPNAPAQLVPYLLILYFVGKELVAPLFSVEINKAISAAGRATFLSGYNLTCSVGEVASGLLVGVIASRLGLPAVFVFGGAVLVLTVAIAMFASKPVANQQMPDR